VFEWYERFTEGTEDVEGEVTMITDENMGK
jgi:hypothetical protein